ncbi:MAG: carbohydrate kinase family protein [Gammaproteobacteria bacterium]|nr:carbohydrate kinase family protein [Gammaproteobacteria bacterium]MCY4219945.1 carbohydrate kinase family protein [Gammaproteobacteria bacterium]MCY4275419.1 carbohydrate kinase family protein [Gammaproteobacteria bacterium]
MATLITGSIAYDTILVFQDRFANHILADQVHIINLSLIAEGMRKDYGGCCGNISYNLNLLGGNAIPMGTVGKDFAPYRQWMHANGLDTTHIHEIEGTYTAQAFVTTDIDNNQITAFHPGAMKEASTVKALEAKNIELAIVAPNDKQAMTQHIRQLHRSGIPLIFDPGQALPSFTGEELVEFISIGDYVCVNDYECQLMSNKTGLSLALMQEKAGVFIVTHGAGGSHVYVEGQEFTIKPAKVSAVVDPTGCGDAYRAGLLYGIENKLDWQTSAQLGSLMGAIKVEHAGTQNHSPTHKEIEGRFYDNFKKTISLA